MRGIDMRVDIYGMQYDMYLLQLARMPPNDCSSILSIVEKMGVTMTMRRMMTRTRTVVTMTMTVVTRMMTMKKQEVKGRCGVVVVVRRERWWDAPIWPSNHHHRCLWLLLLLLLLLLLQA